MRMLVVQIRRKKRSEYPETLLVQVSNEEAQKIDHRVRQLFESGKIKDFLVQEVGAPGEYRHADAMLREIE